MAVIVLIIDRQILIRHIPQCWFPSSKEMISTFLYEKKCHQCTATSMTKVPKNNKTICTSLFWHWIKGKLLNILCAVTQNCKAILTLSTKSLQYLMAVHILNLRALEKQYKWFSVKTKHNTLQHLSSWEGSSCAVDCCQPFGQKTESNHINSCKHT